MRQTLANLLGASAINAPTQIMETAALFGRAVDLEEVPAVLEPLFGGLAAVLFSAASLQCWCSATPRAGGFRPLRRGSPPASSTPPRRSPHFTSAPAPSLHAVRAVAGLAGGHGGGANGAGIWWGQRGRRPPWRAQSRNGGLLLRRRLGPHIFLSASLSPATRRTTFGLTICSSFSVSRNASLGARPINRKNSSRVKLLRPPPASLGEAEALPAAVRHQPLRLQLPHHLQGAAGLHAEGPGRL
jgi:hypothetical protein